MLLRCLPILVLVVVSSPASNARARPLVVSSLPFVDATKQATIFDLLGEQLAEQLGRPVVFAPGESYASVIAGLESGKIDVALLGAAAYVETRRSGDVRAILRSIRRGAFDYQGTIIVKRGSGITRLGDLTGKRFAYVDRSSTSGYYFPRQLMRQAGLKPERDLRAVFAGRHERVVEMVAAGEADAGACFAGAEASSSRGSAVQVIARTEKIPGDPVVVRAGLGLELVNQLRTALTKLATLPAAQPFFKAANIQAFVPAFDSDYDGVAALVGG